MFNDRLGDLMANSTYARATISPAVEPRDLARISLFRGLEPETHARFATEVTALLVQPGEVVIEQGDLSTDVYLVLSGGLIGVLLSEAGKEIAFTEISAGSYFGELAALDSRP